MEKFKSPSSEGPSTKLTPEQIKEINWVVFSRENGAPFNLAVFLDPYVFNPDYNDGLARRINLFDDLLNTSIFTPYVRWQISRLLINPFWSKGSGFEGHLVGLTPKEIRETLSQQEKYLGRNGCDLKNPARLFSLKDAGEMSIYFEIILAKMRALRSNLQEKHPENKQYQDIVYNMANMTSLQKPNFTIDGDSLVIGFNSPITNQININNTPLFGDIRNEFPLIAEIGRFGFPPLRILLGHLSHYNLI